MTLTRPARVHDPESLTVLPGGPRARGSVGARRRLLGSATVIAVAYLGLALTFSFRTGAWENDDEVDHVRYAEHLLATGRLPPLTAASGDEAHQSPLYYLLLAGWQTLLRIPAFAPSRLAVAAPAPGTRYLMWSHHYTNAQHQQAIWLHELRLFSVLCGLATVLGAYATGWLLTRTTSTAAAIAAGVALWPKFLVVAAAVTNSALVDALCAWALPCWLLWHRSRRPAWAVTTGAVLGAAVLTQVTALPLAVLLLTALVIAARRRHDQGSPVRAIGVFVAVCGWWFVRNAVVYRDPLASAATARYLGEALGYPIFRPDPALTPDVAVQVLPVLGRSVWYSGGWDQLHLPIGVDILLWCLALISIGSVFVAARSGPARHFVILAGAVGSMLAWLLIARDTNHAQGRYLLTGVTAWSMLLVEGACRRLPGRPWSRWAWPGVFLALDLYLVATILIPYGTL